MSPGRTSNVATEQGFGTGLRASPARRRPSDERACAELPGEIAEMLALLESQSIDPTALRTLRAELEASFAREQELRDGLSIGGAEPVASTGSGESELHAFELALAERERELAREHAELDEERATLSGIESELALATARNDKLEQQIAQKVTQLKEADADRTRLERELRAHEADLSVGTADRKRELDGRERALTMRAEELVERAETLDTRSTELAAQERALALAIDHLAEKSEELRDLEISLDARDEEIEELRLTVQAAVERLAEATGGDPGKVRDVITIIDSLEERESALDKREEEIVKQLAEAERRPTEAERRNAAPVTLEPDLGRRERESESDWWAKQLGQTETKVASPKKKAGSNRLRVIN